MPAALAAHWLLPHQERYPVPLSAAASIGCSKAAADAAACPCDAASPSRRSRFTGGAPEAKSLAKCAAPWPERVMPPRLLRAAAIPPGAKMLGVAAAGAGAAAGGGRSAGDPNIPEGKRS